MAPPRDGTSQVAVQAPVVGSTDRRSDLAALYQARRSHFVGLAQLVATLDREAAEDAVQDAFSGVYRAASKLGSDVDLDAYVARSVINAAHSMRRQGSRQKFAAGPTDAMGTASAEDVASQATDRTAVMAALARLPKRQRECAVCHYQLGMSQSQVATALGLPIGTIKTHLRRAKAALTADLEDHT